MFEVICLKCRSYAGVFETSNVICLKFLSVFDTSNPHTAVFGNFEVDIERMRKDILIM